MCKYYPALSPFEVDEKKYREVADIYGDVLQLIRRNDKEKKAEKKVIDDQVIRRPAGDNWF